MASIVLDTGPLADFLGQFFGPAQRGHVPFRRGDSLSEDAARAINAILRAYHADEPSPHLVIASTLAFVEVCRKWDRLAGGRFAPHQLKAFLTVTPPWFAVDPVDEDLVEFFLRLPVDVLLEDGRPASIEWTDAVHAATALSRDTPRGRCLLAVEDQRMLRIELLQGRCV
jgi:hypothetical protein